MPHAQNPEQTPPGEPPPVSAGHRWSDEVFVAAQVLIEHSRRLRRESMQVIQWSLRLREKFSKGDTDARTGQVLGP